MLRELALCLFGLAILSALLVSCSWTRTAEPQLNGPVGLVRFPEPWLKVIGSSVWIEDRYVIMPLDCILDHCLVGVLPEP